MGYSRGTDHVCLAEVAKVGDEPRSWDIKDMDEARPLTEIPYTAPLLGNIRQILTGLQGFSPMARELIQNADDAGARRVRFSIEEESLRVWNDAPFSSCGLHESSCPWEQAEDSSTTKRKACDFHAISAVGSGNKYQDPHLIGRFGIGFVSVYQITDAPIVRSVDLQIQLNPLQARNFILEIAHAEGSEFILPWAFDSNSPTRRALNASAVRPEDLHVIQNDLITVADECLLFLRNLTSIEIFRNGSLVRRVTRTNLDKNLAQLSFFPDAPAERWYVIRASAATEGAALSLKFPALARLARQTDIQIAFSVRTTTKRSFYLFAYLPTEQSSPIPCHINADFFPEQNRRSIVLSGSQHERYWNEMLLDVAARAISTRLLELRDALGAEALWQLIDQAFNSKSSPQFGCFWRATAEMAGSAEIILTTSGRWLSPNRCHIAPPETNDDEEQALTHISIELVHRSLHGSQNAMLSLGASRLSLAPLVNALERWDGTELDKDADKGDAFNRLMHSLWKITNELLPAGEPNNDSVKKLIARLQNIRLAPIPDGALEPIKDLYRLPGVMTVGDIEQAIPGLPLVADTFRQFERLHKQIDLLEFGRLLVEIAARIRDQKSAGEFFGADKKHIRLAYQFICTYPGARAESNLSPITGTPFLVGHGRFLTPSEAVLPGGFQDPIGRLATLDLSYFDDTIQEFLREVLKVRVLTFEAYITNSLPEILRQGVTNEEYSALWGELLSHQDITDDATAKRTLSDLPIVRTVNGVMRRPRDCYFRTRELVAILGETSPYWVDETLFRTSKRDFVQTYLRRLGLRTQPSFEHVIDRIEEITEEAPTENLREAALRLLVYVSDLFEDEQMHNREAEFGNELRRLQTSSWLPASLAGQPCVDRWFAPQEVYRPFRASGFESQVRILAIRLNPRHPLNIDFLDALDMPAEPPTNVVVEHLKHCVENGIQPSDVVYQILNERVQREDDLSSIEELTALPCIYDSNKKVYVPADRTFWSKPRIPRVCHKAPQWMLRHKELFEFLGVKESPDARTYVGVLQDIAREFGAKPGVVPPDVQFIHETSLKALAAEFEQPGQDSDNALTELVEYPFLITLAGTLAFADEVAINDSQWLADAFGDELDGRLVQLNPDNGGVLQRLDLRRLSAVTRIEPVRLGDEVLDENASQLIVERHALLLRLFSGVGVQIRRSLQEALGTIQVVRCDLIQARSVFALTDPAVVSTPRNEEILFDRNTNKLFVHIDLGDFFWIPALRVIFATLLAGYEEVDVPKCALSGSLVLRAPSEEAARLELHQAGVAELPVEVLQQPEGSESDIGDLPPEEAQHTSEGHSSEAAGQCNENNGPPDKQEQQHRIGFAPTSSKSPVTGAQPEGRAHAGAVGLTAKPAQSDIGRPTSGSPVHETSAKRQSGRQRTQWMRSYVMPLARQADEATRSTEALGDRSTEIDEAAMLAALEYETNNHRYAERMPHSNPGYDILSSAGAGGKRRIIEVKGLFGEWTERGVKLTRTQIMNAEEYGDEYWLYVIEHALDDKKQNIHAVQNPFFKADEFWFDYIWRDIADEEGRGVLSRLAPGRKIRVDSWGEGTILEVRIRGVITTLTIEFSMHGRRNLPFNSDRMELVED